MQPSPKQRPPLSGVQLLIGIMSYRAPVALSRRHAMRSLMTLSPKTALRFVLADSTPDEDSGLPDVLLLPVKESSRTIGTYLLTNAFLRYAVHQTAVPYIGRADDDSLFDPTTVLSELNALPSQWDNVIYGPFHEWYMWSPNAMMPTCFGYSRERHLIAILQSRSRLRSRHPLNQTGVGLIPRFQRECLYDDVVGPYPFAKGPLVVYSRSVAARLVSLPQFADDEEYALRGRKQVPLRNTVSGRVLGPAQKYHPSHFVIFDDIYYGYLVLLAFSGERLALVHARLSEYRKDRNVRLNTHGGRVRVFHKLKTAERFSHTNRSDPGMCDGCGRAHRRARRHDAHANAPAVARDSLSAHSRSRIRCARGRLGERTALDRPP